MYHVVRDVSNNYCITTSSNTLPTTGAGVWYPSASWLKCLTTSVKDDKKDYVDEINLAGFKKENITVKVKEISKGWFLATIKAVRGEGESKQTKTRDIEIDAFKYNVKEISAKYEDGLLTVTIPRKLHPVKIVEIQ